MFSQSLQSVSLDRRREMVQPDRQELSVVLQCELIGMSRSNWYFRLIGESERNL